MGMKRGHDLKIREKISKSYLQVIPFIIGGEQPAMCLANVPVYRELDLGGGVI